MTDKLKRRRLLQRGAAIIVTGLSSSLLAATLTPTSTSGPFYPDIKAEDDDNNLISVKGQDRLALGEIAQLSGTVQDANGEPIADARVEIWQCDFNGRYRHSSEQAHHAMDQGFQGFGQSVTNASGEYAFTTIKPVRYPGRTPHIHFLVDIAGMGRLVSQLYVEGEAGNQSDFLYQRMSPEQRVLATTTFDDSNGAMKASFNIIVGAGNLA
ncbi:MAG: protocatechuate 3,4-dioxygenase beta subunit [Gammaproteobacteria bacterium]|jgi:protocatechuate 3,4-dioxygenase beta subunit